MSKRVVMLLISIQLIFLINLVKSIDEKKFNYTLFTEDDSHGHDRLRTLYSKSSSKGGIYTKPFLDNNITGTGFYLKDAAYRALCETLNCATTCCEGMIQVLSCGIPENCQKYQNYVDTQRMIGIVIGCVIGILFLIYCIAHVYKDGNHKARSGFASLLIFAIVCLPITIIYLICCRKKRNNNGNQPQAVEQ